MNDRRKAASAGRPRRTLRRGLLVLAAVAATAVTIPAVTAPPAQAHDSYPCLWNGQSGWSAKYYCGLINGRIPVLSSPWNHRTVGWLVGGNGYRNWFLDQTCVPSRPYYYNSFYGNAWWARTMADNGEWGYVPEVYFAGGLNWEADGNLPWRDGASGGDPFCTPW